MKTSIGYRILDGRYALLECLAISGTGEVYRGRDLERTQTHGATSLILIHLLPATLVSAGTDESLFRRICQLSDSLNKAWILPALAYGKDGDQRYIILQCPNVWGLKSLMSLPGSGATLQSQLNRQLGSLVRSNHLPNQVDSALFVTGQSSTPYMLATALAPELQRVQNACTTLALAVPPPWRKVSGGVAVMAIALGTVTAAVLNRSQEVHLAEPAPIAASQVIAEGPSSKIALDVAEIRQTETLLTTTEVAVAPLLVAASATPAEARNVEPRLEEAQQQTVNLVVSQGEPLPATALPENPLVGQLAMNAGVLSAEPIASAPSVTKPLHKPKLVAKGGKKAEAPSETSQVVSRRGQLKAASAESKVSLTKADLEATPTGQTETHVYISRDALLLEEPQSKMRRLTQRPSIIEPVEQALSLSSEPTPMSLSRSTQRPLSLDDLIQRGELALQQGVYTAEPASVLYYARAIRQQAPLHPQVERLSREVVLYYHEQIRELLLDEQGSRAVRLLNTSRDLIQEFNLKHLNPAQQVLEHKAGKYS